jgi:hypothetical protein
LDCLIWTYYYHQGSHFYDFLLEIHCLQVFLELTCCFLIHYADLGSLNGHFWDYQEGYQNGLDYSDHYLDHLVFRGLRLIYDDFHHCLKNIIYHR